MLTAAENRQFRVEPSGAFGIVRSVIVQPPNADPNAPTRTSDETSPPSEAGTAAARPAPAADPNAPTRTSETQTSPPSEAGAPAARPALSPTGSERLPAPLQYRDPDRYEIIAEHGRGGLGRVLRAHDKELGRSVAIKEILQRSGGTTELRFFREALITARLEHPGIVPVHEAGRWPDGTPFYAMKLVAGRPLKALIEEAKTLEQRLALIPHVIAVADAIAYAHSCRIIHRDLKPSNVIVGDFGETVVIDWGLAKDLSDDNSDVPDYSDPPTSPQRSDGLTAAGSVLGTPAYMAPEQSRGARVDQRTDVFALGGILFHVLHGAPPGTPVTPPKYPVDLKAILAKATAHSANDRYLSASAFAEDLRRFQRSLPVSARNYTTLDKLTRITWRHRRLLTFAALGLIALVALSIFFAIRVSSERNRVTSANVELQATLQELTNERDRQQITRARLELLRDPTRAQQTLAQYTGSDMLTAHGLFLEALDRGTASTVLTSSFTILKMMPEDDGDILISTGYRDLIRFNPSNGAHTTIARQLSEYGMFATGSQGKYIAYIGANNQVYITDGKSSRAFAKLPSLGGLLQMTEDEKWVAVLDNDRNLRICDLQNTIECKLFADVTSVRLSPTADSFSLCRSRSHGEIVALPDYKIVRSWDCPMDFYGRIEPLGKGHGYAAVLAEGRIATITSSRTTVLPDGLPAPVRFVSTNKNGDYLVAANSLGTVRIWHVPENKAIDSWTFSTSNSPLPVTSIAISESANFVAISLASGEIRLVDRSSKIEHRLLGHGHGPHLLQFISETRLISNSIDSMRIWNIEYIPSIVAITGLDAFFHVSFIDENRVASDSRSGHVVIYDTHAGTLILDTKPHPSGAFGLAVSPRGHRIAIGGRDGTVAIFNTQNNAISRLAAHNAIVRDLMFFDEDTLVSCGADGLVRLWMLDRNTNRTIASYDDECYRIATNISTRNIATASYDGRIAISHLDTQDTSYIRVSKDRVNTLIYTTNGTLVAGTASGEVLQVADATTITILQKRSAAVTQLTWHDKFGLLIASADGNLSVRQGNVLRPLMQGSQVAIQSIAISQNAKFVAVGYKTGTLRVLRTNDLAVAALRGHSDTVASVCFSPDSSLLVSVGHDGQIRYAQTNFIRFISLNPGNISLPKFFLYQNGITEQKYEP